MILQTHRCCVDNKSSMQSKKQNLIIWLIATTLLFPVFFQLSGGIFDSPDLIIDSKGVLDKLPLPISIGACLFGGIVFSRNYCKTWQSIIFIFTFFITMSISMLFAGSTHGIKGEKIILALQFLLPTMGLILGQLVYDENNTIPKAFMWLLLLFVPLQLFVGWWQHTLTLTHYLYGFNIYQHFQFVPVIFVIAFCFVIVHLWEHHKIILRSLIFIMGVYVIASASFLAITAYCCFLIIFFILKMSKSKVKRLTSWMVFGACVVVAAVVAAVYFYIAKNNKSIVDDNAQYTNKFQALVEGRLPVNVVGRLSDWRLYGGWIIENERTLLFGHVAPPPREVKTSAHNWYLDFAYNFGLIALLPMCGLIIFTSWKIWRLRKYLSEQTLWLAGLVAFLVLVDSNFKVTLRQPYPGIFAFFLWGLLLSRLRPGLAIKTDS